MLQLVCLWHTSYPHGIYWDFLVVKWIQTRYWSEQAWLPSLVRSGSDLRDPQDAFLLFVLLPEGSPAQVQQRTIFLMIILQLFNSSCSYAAIYNFFSFLFLFFLGLTTHACWLHLEKVMKNWRSRWKPKRYKATLSQHRCVCVFWPALCLCSVTGGPTRWGTWRKWLCSNWQSEWLCQSSQVTSNLTWTAVAKFNIWTYFFFFSTF